MSRLFLIEQTHLVPSSLILFVCRYIRLGRHSGKVPAPVQVPEAHNREVCEGEAILCSEYNCTVRTGYQCELSVATDTDCDEGRHT